MATARQNELYCRLESGVLESTNLLSVLPVQMKAVHGIQAIAVMKAVNGIQAIAVHLSKGS